MRLAAGTLALLFVAGLVAPAAAAPAPVQPRTHAAHASGSPATHSAATSPTPPVASRASPADDRPASVEPAAADTQYIVRHVELSLTPGDPGTIRARVSYDVPDSLRSLTVSGVDNATVVESNGFDRRSDGSLRWDGETESPSLVLSVDANRSVTGSRVHGAAADAGHAFVDAGPWALVAVPRFYTQWEWVGTSTVRLRREASVDGPGATGGEIAFLGAGETVETTAGGQHFRLYVPRAAEMRESPDAVLASLSSASTTLQVGARDEEVFFVAAPTGVNWGPAGLEYGGNDAWVQADRRLDVARNAWLHEYVHTRQNYNATAATLWTVEATAEYYAGLLTLRQGRIDFEQFREQLARGSREPYADAVLADPGTWRPGTNYFKGALVYGNVDRRIRLAADSRTAGDVLARMNADGDRVTLDEFLAWVGAAGNETVRAYARRYTTTRAAPEMWSAAEHRAAFAATSAGVEYAVPPGGFAVSGPYRNRTYDAPPTLVTGETLAATVRVRNHGDDEATYNVTLRADGDPVAARSGRLAPGESATVTLTHTFEATGSYALSLGSDSRGGRVVEPAAATVSSVEPNRTTVPPDTTVAVTATTRNPTDRPATSTFPVRVDGTDRGTWTVHLPENGTATRTFTVTVEEPGTHTVTVGNRTSTIRVETESPSFSVPAPGFGIGTAVAALVALLALAAGSRRT